MKTTFFALLAGLLLTLVSCQTSPQSMLENDSKRAALYREILNNHAYTKQLIDSLHSNPHGRMMMAGEHKKDDKADMGGMMKDMMKNMMSKSEKDTTSADAMCTMMCESKPMSERMIKMLHKNGIVDDACYKKGIEKVKAMPEAQTKSQPKPEATTKDEHAEHH